MNKINRLERLKQLYNEGGIYRIFDKVRNVFYKKVKYNLAETARICEKSLVHIDKTAEVKDYVVMETHYKPIYIGRNSQICEHTVIFGEFGVHIGNNVMIAPHVVIASGNHDYKQTAKPMRFAGALTEGGIIIQDDVWIGANSTITDGVIIGAHAVIGANSVVTHNVNSWDIVAGVPARVIGSRLK